WTCWATWPNGPDRGATPSQHVREVGAPRRVGVRHLLQRGGGDAVPDRESEEVDYLLGVWPKQMCAEHSIGAVLDDRLEHPCRFTHATAGVPARCFLRH